MTIIVMVMQMHLSGRRLITQGFVTAVIFPDHSILPGCISAIPMVRILLRRQLSSLIMDFPQVRQSVHVDDIGQVVVGKCKAIGPAGNHSGGQVPGPYGSPWALDDRKEYGGLDLSGSSQCYCESSGKTRH